MVVEQVVIVIMVVVVVVVVAMVAGIYALRRSRAELLRHHQIDVTKGKRLCGLK